MNSLQILQHNNALREFHKQLRKLVREEGYGTRTRLGVGDDKFEQAMAVLSFNVQRAVQNFEKKVMRQRTNYCVLFSLKPARRAKSAVTGKPLTLVESRAVAAKKKVETWQRKAKLANTKIKIYRRKVTYYKKKGVI